MIDSQFWQWKVFRFFVNIGIHKEELNESIYIRLSLLKHNNCWYLSYLGNFYFTKTYSKFKIDNQFFNLRNKRVTTQYSMIVVLLSSCGIDLIYYLLYIFSFKIQCSCYSLQRWSINGDNKKSFNFIKFLFVYGYKIIKMELVKLRMVIYIARTGCTNS